MSYRRIVEGRSSAPLPDGAKSSPPPLDLAQVQSIVHRRLETLAGGDLLSVAGISRLTRRLSPRQYTAGEVILKQGVRGDFLAVVSQGQVAVLSPQASEASTSARSNDPTVLLLPGSTFGEAMLLEGRPSGSTLAAFTNAEIYVLRRADLLAVAQQRSSRPRLEPRLMRRRGWALVLLLLAIVLLVGLYAAMTLLDGGFDQVAGRRTESELVPGVVNISAPQDGDVVQKSASIPIQAVVSEPGYLQAELRVDGIGQAVEVNTQPATVPWLVEWAWQDPGEGSHNLAIRIQGDREEWLLTSPITVTVVPDASLAFTSNRDGPSAVYVMDADGRRSRRVTAGPGDTRQPAWGTDELLAFVTEPDIGQPVIQQLRVQDGEKQDLVSGRDPAWSPGATHLAYAATSDDISQVYVLEMESGTPAQVTTEEVYAGQPAWLPDGTGLAYAAERGENWDIWAVGLDGGEPTRLTDDPAMDWAPDWSPDGSQLAFVSDRDGSYQIYVMQADGTGVRRLTEFPQGAEAPAWSPDGYWLAFVAYAGEGTGVGAREIYLMRVDGQDQVRLTYNAFDDAQPDWQPWP
jgi:TolB protein